MPSIRVIGGQYPAWLVRQGWEPTPDGASEYLRPDDIWVTIKRKGRGSSAGPQHLMKGMTRQLRLL